MNAIEIRSKFINYFVEHGHIEISGTPLIQENDSSVLFTTAGMHPLVPYLLGKPHPEGSRLTDYQKCLRTDDIEEVGDEIHMTFFEMLGNWSMGDYFKEESIRMSYEFLTKVLSVEPERIAVTIFEGDENIPEDTESENVWNTLGIPENNIFKYGRKHNWWGPVGRTGPCGPDTEIFFDTLKPKCSDDCGPSCKCGKYWEMWNNVFMEYNKESDGTFTELKQKNVDTGMGLERITAIVEKKDSIFDTELFCNIINRIAKNSKRSEDEIRFMAEFYAFGMTGIIISWAQRGMKETPEYITKQLENLAFGTEKFAAERYQANTHSRNQCDPFLPS
jgi:alanyl-tRNA synthetase